MQSVGIDVHFFAASFAASTLASSSVHVEPSFFASPSGDGPSAEASLGGGAVSSAEASVRASEVPPPTVQSREQPVLIAQTMATKHRRDIEAASVVHLQRTGAEGHALRPCATVPAMIRRGSVSAWLSLFAVVVFTSAARGEDSKETEARARDAYERGSLAYQHGDYARAAREFGAADALVPNDVTLRTALEAVVLADDPVLGTELALRGLREPGDRELKDAVAVAKARFAHRTGKVVTTCPLSAQCMTAIDGAPVEPSVPRVVTIGVHTVSFEVSGPIEQRMVEVRADETVGVTLEPRQAAVRPTTSPAPVAHGGVSPVWFFTALAVTGVSAGLLVWSGIDTLDQHASFEDAGCIQGGGSACASQRSGGLSAQARTNVFFVTTGVLAVGTAALGIFAVRWRKDPAHETALFLGGSGLSLASAF
jgi:hypothetical protein